MKKPILYFLLVFSVTLTEIGSAKTVKYVELGINQSRFRNQECKSKIGPSFGLGLDYYPIKSFGAFIGTELLYQNKKLLVEDKTCPSDRDVHSAGYVITSDIDINISYLEVPLQIGYRMKFHDQFSAIIFTGYSLLIPMKDHTKGKNKSYRLLTPAERGTFDFDYVLVDESGVSMSKNFNIALRLSYKQFALLISYAKAISFTQDIAGINIQGKLDSFKMSFAFLF